MQLDITVVILIITCLISFGGFSNQKIIDDLIFYPPAITQRKQWYRFFSCGLIHADISHLLFNMLTLYLFGRSVERGFMQILPENGKWIYLLMYVSALLISLLPTYFKNRNNYKYRSLGASGAVSAVVFAGLILAPDVRIGFFLIPPIIPGFIFGPLYLIISAWLDRRGGDNINHSAHFWGAIYGLVFIIVVSRIAGFDAISYFLDGVKNFFNQ